MTMSLHGNTMVLNAKVRGGIRKTNHDGQKSEALQLQKNLVFNLM